MARLAPILGGLLAVALIACAVQSWRVGSLQDTVKDLREALTVARTRYAVFHARVIDNTAHARAADKANVSRVLTEQKRITEERDNAYRSRIAALDARVAELRQRQGKAGNSGGATAPMPNSGEASSRADAASGSDGFSLELRAAATRQAIRLDELQKWVKSQGQVDNTGGADGGGQIDYLNAAEGAVSPP